MGQLNRRQMLRGSAALGAGTALGGAGALLERARAWAGEMPWRPEPGARLRVLRWTPFSSAESAVFEHNLAAFSAATGIDVHLASELAVDAIVAPRDLRRELVARLRAAWGRRDPDPPKRRGVTPV